MKNKNSKYFYPRSCLYSWPCAHADTAVLNYSLSIGHSAAALSRGLEPGKKYWFRTFVTGSKGQQVMGTMLLSPYVQ